MPEEPEEPEDEEPEETEALQEANQSSLKRQHLDRVGSARVSQLVLTSSDDITSIA